MKRKVAINPSYRLAGEIIRRSRKKRKMTCEQVANKINLHSKSFIAMVERGERRFRSTDTIRKLAKPDILNLTQSEQDKIIILQNLMSIEEVIEFSREYSPVPSKKDPREYVNDIMIEAEDSSQMTQQDRQTILNVFKKYLTKGDFLIYQARDELSQDKYKKAQKTFASYYLLNSNERSQWFLDEIIRYNEGTAYCNKLIDDVKELDQKRVRAIVNRTQNICDVKLEKEINQVYKKLLVEFEKAITAFEKSYTLSEYYRPTLCYLALMYTFRCFFKKANYRSDADQALQYWQEFVGAYNSEHDKVKSNRRSRDTDTDSLLRQCSVWEAIIHARLENFSMAYTLMRMYFSMVKSDPEKLFFKKEDIATYYYNLGRIQSYEGKHSESLKSFKTAIEFDPKKKLEFQREVSIAATLEYLMENLEKYPMMSAIISERGNI